MQGLGLAQPEIAWHTVRDRIGEVACFLGLLTGHARQDFHGREAPDADRGRRGLRALPRGARVVEHDAAEAQSDLVPLYPLDRRTGAPSTSPRCSKPPWPTTSARTGPWEIEWISLPRNLSAGLGALGQTKLILPGLEVDADRMRANLDLTRGMIVSEAVMMGLAPHLGVNGRTISSTTFAARRGERGAVGRPVGAGFGYLPASHAARSSRRCATPALISGSRARWWTRCWRRRPRKS